MALNEGIVHSQHFVEEIDYNEIEQIEVCITATNFRQQVLKLLRDILQTNGGWFYCQFYFFSTPWYSVFDFCFVVS